MQATARFDRAVSRRCRTGSAPVPQRRRRRRGRGRQADSGRQAKAGGGAGREAQGVVAGEWQARWLGRRQGRRRDAPALPVRASFTVDARTMLLPPASISLFEFEKNHRAARCLVFVTP